MPELELVLGGALAAPMETFEVVFADDDGEQRLELTAALSVPFESCRPVREFTSSKGATPSLRPVVDGHDRHVGGLRVVAGA